MKSAPPKRGFFTVPASIKYIFDKFPLITYETNDLPLRSRRILGRLSPTAGHTLFVWTTNGSHDDEQASFNPVCLKWQVRRLGHGFSMMFVS